MPFVVANEDAQDFHFDLDFGELDIVLADEHADAVVRIDGKLVAALEGPAQRVGVGSHVIEINKPGFHPITQRIVVGPREVKTLMYQLESVNAGNGLMVREAPKLDVKLGYQFNLYSYQATGQTSGGDEATQDGRYPFETRVAPLES